MILTSQRLLGIKPVIIRIDNVLISISYRIASQQFLYFLVFLFTYMGVKLTKVHVITNMHLYYIRNILIMIFHVGSIEIRHESYQGKLAHIMHYDVNNPTCGGSVFICRFGIKAMNIG